MAIFFRIHFHPKKSEEIIEQFAQTVIDTLAEHKELLEEFPQIGNTIISSVSKCMRNVG